MKKTFFGVILSLALAILGSAAPAPASVSAQVAPAPVNARILPILWYSDLSPAAGQSVIVHAGIQNNSGADFSGTVTLYVDDAAAGEKAFSSRNDSLQDVSVPWAATAGNHVFQMKASASLPSSEALISYKTDLSYLSVSSPPVSVASVADAAAGAASSFASGIAAKADSLAASIVKSLDAAKQETGQASAGAAGPSSTGSRSGTLRAAGQGAASSSLSASSNGQMAAVFNAGIDVLAFLVDQWRWTLSAVVLAAAILFFKSRAAF